MKAYVVIGALAVLLAATAGAAEPLRLGGSGACTGALELLIEEFRRSNPDVPFAPVAVLGSGGALRAVEGGALDIALLSRPLSDAERARGLRHVEYGRTPFVIAVGERIPVAGITSRELAQILSGTHERWPHGVRTRAVLRPEADIDTDLLRNIAPEVGVALDAAIRRPGMIVAPTDRDAADAIEKTPGAIGASTLALILSEKRAMRPLALDGVAPTVEALEAGAYRHQKRLSLAWGPRALRPEAGRFVEFVQSARARAILRATGHAPPGKGN